MSIQNKTTLNKILRDYHNVKLDMKVLEGKYASWFESYLKKYKVLVDKLEKINEQLIKLKETNSNKGE